MKKSLKAMALGLAIVPCALVLTACGGGDGGININTDGNYVAVETTEYANVLADLQTRGLTIEDIVGGARLTLDVDADVNLGGITMGVVMSSDNYVRNSSEAGTLDVTKVDMISENSLTMTTTAGEETTTTEASANMYFSQGVQYVDLTGAEELLIGFGASLPSFKFSQSLVTGNPEEDVVATPEFNIADLLQYIPEGSYGTGLVIETSEEGDDYKVRVTLNGTFMQEYVTGMIAESDPELASTVTFNSFGDIVIYVVCNADGLVGMNVTGSVDMSIAITVAEGQDPMLVTVDGDIELNMAGYNGEFDMPTDLNEENYAPIDVDEPKETEQIQG